MDFLRREGKILLVSLILGLIFAGGVAAYSFVYSVGVQRDIADNVLRFHVVAHSDYADEQELKELVRTEILEEFADLLAAKASIDETRATLAEILPGLQEHAQEIVRAAGSEHGVTADMATVFFPTQFYGNIAFPPGLYEAVQIIIGDGDGENWWCLMFPPLCYVEMTATETSRDLLAANVSEEGLRLLLHQENAAPQVQVRFRMVEWWQNRRNSAPSPPNEQQYHIVQR